MLCTGATTGEGDQGLKGNSKNQNFQKFSKPVAVILTDFHVNRLIRFLILLFIPFWVRTSIHDELTLMDTIVKGLAYQSHSLFILEYAGGGGRSVEV